MTDLFGDNRVAEARAWLETLEEPERVLANDIVQAHLKHMSGHDPDGFVTGFHLSRLHKEWTAHDEEYALWKAEHGR